jgi:hypothetical protein
VQQLNIPMPGAWPAVSQLDVIAKLSRVWSVAVGASKTKMPSTLRFADIRGSSAFVMPATPSLGVPAFLGITDARASRI